MRISTKFNEAYKSWHSYFVNLPRHSRFTIGAKIDDLFTDCIKLAFLAGYASRSAKSSTVEKLSAQFDALKFFIKLIWEMDLIDDKKYTHLSTPLVEIGKMIGAWLKASKNSRENREK